jgi:hypothetical protein
MGRGPMILPPAMAIITALHCSDLSIRDSMDGQGPTKRKGSGCP